MKKLAEKVALVAELCISLVFILTTLLYITNAIPQQENWQSNGVLVVLMLVLALAFLGMAAFLIYMNFADRENMRHILLFCDSESATHTNIKVIQNIVGGCAKQVNGITVRKIRIRSDEKGGLAFTLKVKVTVDNVAESVNKLRCLLTESFKSTLGLTFNTINFQIERLSGKYSPDTGSVEETAEVLAQNQELTSANYEKPTDSHSVDIIDNSKSDNDEFVN